jgi:hypothetical protein
VSDGDDPRDFHLPAPSGTPIAAGLGVAILLFGFVPDSRLWRFTIVSVVAMLLAASLWRWIADSIDEYRNLPE